MADAAKHFNCYKQPQIVGTNYWPDPSSFLQLHPQLRRLQHDGSSRSGVLPT
jgi:hypothetical protein